MNEPRPDLRPLPMAVGMALGGLIGFALWIATDTYVFLPAFLGMGVALGLAFGQRS